MNENTTNEHMREIHEMYDTYINNEKRILDIKQKLLHEVFDIMVNVITEHDPMFDIDKNISIGQRTVDLKYDDMTFVSMEHCKIKGISINFITETFRMEQVCDWIQISISNDGKLMLEHSNPLIRPILREIVRQLDILVKAHNIKQTLVVNK